MLFSVKSLGERGKKNANSEKEHTQCNTIRRYLLTHHSKFCFATDNAPYIVIFNHIKSVTSYSSYIYIYNFIRWIPFNALVVSI